MSGRMVRWLLALAHVPRGAGPRLTIIRHHRVYPDGVRALYHLGVSESLLDSQLALLARLGLAPVTVSEGLARLATGARRVVAMSFDDGYADNVERALPRLASHGARATFYLTAGLMEERRAPWWDVLAHAIESARAESGLISHEARLARLRRELPTLRVAPAAQARALDALRRELGVSREAPCELATWELAARLPESGMEVGAHTLTHPFLSLLGVPDQRLEIEGSRDLVARRLGVSPAGLAYPGGDHDVDSVRICEAIGLTHAVTTRSGDVAPGEPCFELRRRGLSEGACLGPGGRFSSRLARAELDGAFDRLRQVEEVAG